MKYIVRGEKAMENKYVINNDIDYFSNILKNYYYLRRQEKRINQELLLLDQKIEDNRCTASAIAYDGCGVVGDGCSVHVQKGGHIIDRYTAQQVELQAECDRIVTKYKRMDQDYNIVERLSKLDSESRIIINNIFERCLTLSTVAKIENVSKQTISNRLKYALERFVNV